MSACPPLREPIQPARRPEAVIRRRLVHWTRSLLKRIEERDRRRRVLRLLDYDDRMLDDMGLSRSEIHEVLTLPLSCNAIVVLHETARLRRRRLMARRPRRR